MNDTEFSKRVRPAMFVWSYVLLTLAVILDGNVGTFSIKDAYIPILETIVITITLAYIGSRGIEKTTAIVKEKGEEDV